jgi:hypothetical protein
VTGVESSIHVRISHCSEKLGVLLAHLGGGHGALGDLIEGGGVDFENLVGLPLRLVLLLNCDQVVTLLGLESS